MPTAISPERPRTGITRLRGGLLVKGDKLVEEDLWISSVTGKILSSQQVFYDHHVVPDETIDLHGKIVSPGLIDVQFNGGFGFDFSTIPDDMADYSKGVKRVNRHLVRTGVTSYLPTIPSQKPEVYHKALPYLGPSGAARNPVEGSESLGAHCEGPFISPTKNGIHSLDVLREAPNGIADLEECYGKENFPAPSNSAASNAPPSPIRLITAAPEVPGIMNAIPSIVARNVIFALGHTEATYEQATAALSRGGTMITHLFNAMRPLHHRNPNIFGTLTQPLSSSSSSPFSTASAAPLHSPPFFGLIADGIHLHPTTVRLAHAAAPASCILVTDAMRTMGQPDGLYAWTNNAVFEKRGAKLTLAGTDTLAGSSARLIDCVSNFWQWTANSDVARLPSVLRTVTAAPAEMLSLQHVKGCLREGADADLCVLSVRDEVDDDENENDNDGGAVSTSAQARGKNGDAVAKAQKMKRVLSVDMVFKFGVCVHDASDAAYGV